MLHGYFRFNFRERTLAKRLIPMLIVAVACISQSGCGTYIPSQRDWPNGSSRLVADMNSTLVRSVVCELSYAVTLAVMNDLDQAKKRPSLKAYGSFLADWGVEVATDLSVTENSTLAPSFSWTPDKPISITTGVSAEAIATNENKYNIFYPISALYRPDLFTLNTKTRPCRDPKGNKEGSPLVDIDLQILPLLESRIQVVQLGLADDPKTLADVLGVKNVLTQTVSIKEKVSGDVTPKWEFTTTNVNPSGTLLSAGRERTHQLVFTFGPLAAGKRALTPLAEQFHLNEQLKAGLRATRNFQ